MPAPFGLHPTPEEDAQLGEPKTNPLMPHKVRRRAQGWTAPRIAHHLGLDRTTARRDLRWEGSMGWRTARPPGPRPAGAFVPGQAWSLPAPGGPGEALADALPPRDGEAEAPGPGVPVEADAVRARGEAMGGGGPCRGGAMGVWRSCGSWGSVWRGGWGKVYAWALSPFTQAAG